MGMKKHFNIAGTCYQEEHYMMDYSKKLAGIIEWIENKKYFTINRPRQYGKTTMLNILVNTLTEKEDYVPLHLNFHGIDSKFYASDEAFAKRIIHFLADEIEFVIPELFVFLFLLNFNCLII